MNTTPQTVTLTTEGFPARAELTALAGEKAAKLLRHGHPRVNTVRLHVKLETPHSGVPFFAARGTTEHAGPDHVVHATAAEPEAAIRAAVDKLERALTTSAGARKHDQHHPHAIDLAGVIPKAGPA